MNNTSNPIAKNTAAWNTFTLMSFGISVVMMAGGIYFLEASFAAKGFYAMSALMLVHTAISATKTMRDAEEANRMVNKIEDARTEKLLMEMGRGNNI
jgi:hypothetical protein